MDVPHNRRLSVNGEDRAASFLEENRFTIIERNYRFGKFGEIDIIASQGPLIVFAEVKSRSSKRFGGALYSISKKKKKSLKTTAKAFIAAHPQYNRPEYMFRFDLIAITGT